MTKIDVAVLGATGAVGQRFIQLLENHPWFQVAEVVASERSSGKSYRDAVHWILPEAIPDRIADLTVREIGAELTSPLVFSALPSGVAREIEPVLAAASHYVCSNASAYRMAEDVPILMPEVNADHIHLIDRQQSERGWSGGIITNSNCTSAPLVMALAPLVKYQPEALQVVSMQAVSGAGYPGVASLDILDNVVPYISNEEEKLQIEPAKMLGNYADGTITPLEMIVSAACNRVPVIDSHLISVAVRFANNPSLDEIRAAWEAFRGVEPVPQLPSAPENPVIVMQQADRPQPRLDRMAGNGMSTVVGRLRDCEAMNGVQFLALAHNTIRGAAGCSILNAELLVTQGYLKNLPEAMAASLQVLA